MDSVIGFTVFGVDWEFLKPYIVLGLALGGVYALSGVGIVVLYQATGVLNLAFGAIGAAGALIAYYLINHTGMPRLARLLACIAFGGAVTLLYGVVLGPAFAPRDPLVKMMGTLALALILLGLMAWRAPAGGAFNRVLTLPTSEHRFELFGAVVNLDAGHRARLRHRAHRRDDALPQATRISAPPTGDRQRSRDHRHARRACAPSRGLGLARLGYRLRRGRSDPRRSLTSLDYSALDVSRHLLPRGRAHRPARSLTATLTGGLSVGLVQALLDAVRIGDAVPHGGTVRALDHRAALARAAPRRRISKTAR